jgi:hypothetical protein
MTSVAAPIWNDIAATQELETEAARLSFVMSATQMARLETVWERMERGEGTPSSVSTHLPRCLPLLVEASAIGSYIDDHPELRGPLPELNSPAEAAVLMQLDWRLTDSETECLRRRLGSPAALQVWLRAARMVVDEQALYLHPLNQAATAILQKAHIPLFETQGTQPDTMPVFQLAALFLNENDLLEHEAVQAALRRQASTFRWLADYLDEDEILEGTPEDAAELILNMLTESRVKL